MSIQEAWKAFKTVRDEEIAEELLKNAEYKNHRAASIALFDTLKDKLSPEDRKILMELEEVETAMEGLCDDFYYMTGLKDGVKLAQQMDLIGSGCSKG